MPDKILISELFGPVFQGEGALSGKVSHFVRTAGCPYRCVWCDSLHAVDPVQIKAGARSLTSEEIANEVLALVPAPWVTLSGGDPVAWDLTTLAMALRFNEYKVAVETQGSLWHDWLDVADLVTCSPKGPSSGMANRLDIAMLQKYVARLKDRLVFKVVVFIEADLDFAERIHYAFPKVPMYISSGTPGIQLGDDLTTIRLATLKAYREVAESLLRRKSLLDVTLGCQNHVLMYGRELAR